MKKKYSYIKIIKENPKGNRDFLWCIIKHGKEYKQLPSNCLPLIKTLLNKINKLNK